MQWAGRRAITAHRASVRWSTGPVPCLGKATAEAVAASGRERGKSALDRVRLNGMAVKPLASTVAPGGICRRSIRPTPCKRGASPRTLAALWTSHLGTSSITKCTPVTSVPVQLKGTLLLVLTQLQGGRRVGAGRGRPRVSGCFPSSDKLKPAAARHCARHASCETH